MDLNEFIGYANGMRLLYTSSSISTNHGGDRVRRMGLEWSHLAETARDISIDDRRLGYEFYMKMAIGRSLTSLMLCVVC